MSKHKRMALMDDNYIDVDKIMITEDTYRSVMNIFKKKNKTNTISHMRDIVYEGKCEGSFKTYNVDGYKFTWNDESVVVDKSGLKFIFASKINNEAVKSNQTVTTNKYTNTVEAPNLK